MHLNQLISSKIRSVLLFCFFYSHELKAVSKANTQLIHYKGIELEMFKYT